MMSVKLTQVALWLLLACSVWASTNNGRKTSSGKPLPSLCARMYCAIPACQDAFIPDGECCPVCPPTRPNPLSPPPPPPASATETCTYKGRLCQHGETFDDDCNICKCWNGAVTCTDNVCDKCSLVKCTPKFCRNAYTPPGECCPICPSEVKQMCKAPDGHPLKHGETVQVDCNTCRCNNGNLACTKKTCSVDRCAVVKCAAVNCRDAYVPPDSCCAICPDKCAAVICAVVDCPDRYTPTGECCPVCPPKKDCYTPDGRKVKHGDSVKVECNTCLCFDGNLACTKKGCISDPCANKVCPQLACPNSYTPPGKCCPVCPPPENCKDDNGKIYKHEETFNKDCNKCICMFGSIRCTEKICDPCANKVCPVVNCPGSYTPTGECCPVCPPPKNCQGPDGKLVKHGDSYKVDCNTCTCWNGDISCTSNVCDPCANKVCPQVSCIDAITPPGECCPVCPILKKCKGPNGQLYNHGDTFKDDCNICICLYGTVTCTKKSCDPCANKVCVVVNCPGSYTPRGECCPVCPPPKNCHGPDGKLVKHGDSYNVDCNTCSCWNGDLKCTDQVCAPKNCKGPDGKLVKHGDSYNVGCNTCTCWNGDINCTNNICDPCANKVCAVVKCPGSYTPRGECCPVCPPPKNCHGSDGKLVKHGDSYNVDCNTCSCWNGDLKCTDQVCDPCAYKVCPLMKCVNSYTPPGSCCPICAPPKNCKGPDGKLVKHGDSYNVDCNTCTCWNGDVSCTNNICDPCANKVCPVVNCPGSYTPPLECCPVCPPPKNCQGPGGKLVKHGDSFNVDCNTCTCWNGDVSCTNNVCDPCANIVCPTVNCPGSYTPPGECCPVCPPPKNCKGPDGKLVKHGDSYNVDCNTCTCWNGDVSCTNNVCDPCANKVCPVVNCPGSYTPPKECCPVCPPPKNCRAHDGKFVKHGDSYNVDCNTCTCWNGGINCTNNVCDPCANKICPVANCPGSYTPTGECCPVCPPPKNCQGPGGKLVKHGDSYGVDCNTCTCWNGDIKCTDQVCDPCANKICPMVKCKGSFTPPGSCCPICPVPKNCQAPGGKLVKHGDSYNVDCNTCTCWNGDISCTEKFCDPCANKVCPQLKCVNTYTPPGSCCPVCAPPKNCQGPGGKLLKDGDSYNVDCNTCTCWNGDIKCTDKVCDPCANTVCPLIKCVNSYTPLGSCCPVCAPLNNCKGPGGKLVQHGDSYNVDCNTCNCWNGDISCSNKVCDPCANVTCPIPVRFCPDGYVPPGECCPVCPDPCAKAICSPIFCTDTYIPTGECCPACKPPKNCHGPGGKMVKHGDSYNVDCNTCTCWNGDITCSNKTCDPCAIKICPVVNCQGSYTPPGECCPVCPDPCAKAICSPIFCTDTYIPPGECCQACKPPMNCQGPGGKLVKHGDSYKVDCHTCTCWNGDITCSSKTCDPCANKLCPVVTCPGSYTPPGECCPVCPPPKNCNGPGGKLVKHGDSYNVDCNTCSCWNGDISCSNNVCDPCANKLCPVVTCPGSYTPPGECCPVCPPPKNCKGPGGKLVKHGDSYNVDCNTCSCWKGDISCSNNVCDPCANKLCPVVTCPGSYTPPGECCPVCPPPKNCQGPGGKLVKHGDSYNVDCNTCSCWNGDISCSNNVCDPCAGIYCIAVACPGAYRPPGSCCDVCPPVTIAPSPCHGVTCSPVTCKSPIVPTGKCCAECPPGKNVTNACLVNGNVYSSGTEVPSTDPCSVCACVDGNVNCAVMDCMPPLCQDTYVPPGQCCPRCRPIPIGHHPIVHDLLPEIFPKVCVTNGQIYNEGDSVPSNEVCQSCDCIHGNVRCSQKVCSPVNCDDSYTPPGDCCPKCPDNNSK